MPRIDSSSTPTSPASDHFARINAHYLLAEEKAMPRLLALARTSEETATAIHNTAKGLVAAVRQRQQQASGLQAFLHHYDLSSEEGIVLMCLAEALLRIPDAGTMDELIADKLSAGDWEKHIGASESLFVNASTWALMLTGKTLAPPLHRPDAALKRLLSRLPEPLIRTAVKTTMRIMAVQFVMGRNIEAALRRAQEQANCGYRYSFDMLGEAALTRQDAERYQAAYAAAISRIGQGLEQDAPAPCKPGISIKLSALHPRYEYTQRERACRELSARLLELAHLARESGIGLTVDAEEAARLELSLLIFENVYRADELGDWAGLGLAVQAYQKRALPVLRWLNALAQEQGRVIPLRLVKGAYWDTEIKQAQELGLRDYPVFTRKCNTDVSYLACARYLLADCEYLYPQFATHNAHTLAYIYHHAGAKPYEFQRLHGMGEELYAEVTGKDRLNIPCRVYAPVGPHEELLPYLVRRLLENGANTSFVNQISRPGQAIEAVIADPVELLVQTGGSRHPDIVLPAQLFADERQNSQGINLADTRECESLLHTLKQQAGKERRSAPVINGAVQAGEKHLVRNPARPQQRIGQVAFAHEASVQRALEVAYANWPDWDGTPIKERARLLDEVARLYQQHQAELLYLCVHEAGKTLPDSHAELREAIDFLRYYAARARAGFSAPLSLPGPTGERNELYARGRGVFLCISPWNFPLAIYTGQLAAALVMGNTVLAKPAEQTSLLAGLATDLMYQAGLPGAALQFVPGQGARIGKIALSDARLAGVAFTGGTKTARAINRQLAARPGALATLIAETGGQNAMIVDSSALAEQVVMDVVQSAFNSAGQRCSALRVLYLQDDIAERVLALLTGHMDELVIGDPLDLATDVGPVIDGQAARRLEEHLRKHAARILHQCRVPAAAGPGHYIAPTVIEIDRINQLAEEHFGPILHIVRYQADELAAVLAQINNSGFGLTLGIHSRIAQRAEFIRRGARVGNVYVNRNMVGAVVGVQPFGGCGLSGTGPKAGGPNYLPRFTTEQTYTVNTAAVGGNASLLGKL